MKVLIVRFSSIGDIVLTSPVARVLHEQLGAEVHFLTKKSFESVVKPNPHIKKVHCLSDSLWQTANRLKSERFDAVIDLHSNLRSHTLCWLLWKRTFRFDKLNIRKWLLVRFKLNWMPKKHIVDRYLAAVSSLGVKNDGRGLDYFIPAQQVINLSLLQAEHPEWERAPNQPYIALVLGAAHATKQMPFELLLKITKQISQPIILLGGPGEERLGSKLSEASDTHVLNLCGALNLHGSASILQQAEKVITPDTGLMHIAAAFKKPIFAVWGNTVPDLGMYPYLPTDAPAHTDIEVKDLPCRPCSKIGFAECPKGHFHCMNKQNYAWQDI